MPEPVYDIDNDDCYTPQEWYENYPSDGNRFLYIHHKYVQKSETYKNDPERHTLSITERNESYRLIVDWNSAFWTNDPNEVNYDEGYWHKEIHYQKPSGSADDYIRAFMASGCPNFKKCTSSRTGYNKAVTTDNWSFDYDISIVGLSITSLFRHRNAVIGVDDVSGYVELYRKAPSSQTSEKRWPDTDNGVDGTGSAAHNWTTHTVKAVLVDFTSDSEAPNIIEVRMPTVNAWERNDEVDWIEGETNLLTVPLSYDYEQRAMGSWYMDDANRLKNQLIPHILSWAQPYPYSKWYRKNDWLTNRGLPKFLSWAQPCDKWYRENGVLKNRRLPDILINDLGAFSGCTNLTRVDIPEGVETIGRYSFYQTALTEVTLPDNCTYYATSFPEDCVVTGGVLIS